MSATKSCIEQRLPICLTEMAIDYFGRATDIYDMGELGQYEDCENCFASLAEGYDGHIFSGACLNNYVEIVKLGISYEYTWREFNAGVMNACYGGHFGLVKMLIQFDDKFDVNDALEGACAGGHIDIAKFMIARGANYFNTGLGAACSSANIEIINLMISCGADIWDLGMIRACRNGLPNIVEMMLAKGATNYNWGLSEACANGHREIAKLMIAKGATVCDCRLSIEDHKRR